jgi:hypothetical protein
VKVTAGSAADGKVLPGPDLLTDRAGTRFLTQTSAAPGMLPPEKLSVARNEGALVFETMHDITLYAAHNELYFYTWGDEQCCLPQGATSATLRDLSTGNVPRLLLRPGDVLVFAERLGPRTGLAGDADPSHRHAVMLTSVSPAAKIDDDGVTREPSDALIDPLTGTPIVEVAWSTDDALPFALCVSSATEDDVSVAWGNIVLADHGVTLPLGSREEMEAVPAAKERRTPQQTYDFCAPKEPDRFVPKYRPRLKEAPVTFSRSFDPGEPAARAVWTGVEMTMPAVSVTRMDAEDGETGWKPAADLLSCGAYDRRFVVETEDDGAAHLRFGDGDHGAQPEAETRFAARYRTGNGIRGNVGRGLAHGAVVGVDNPLPACGGTEPESIAAVRQAAPIAFRTQQRAVTPADYEEVAQRHPEVQRAKATFRWTGSWYTVFLTIDRKNGLPVDVEFEQEMRAHMERFRLAGYDLEVDAPLFVPLELELAVCVKPDYFCGDVEEVLLRVLGSGVRPCGRLGVFSADNLTFGQTIYLSQILAAAQAVAGVASVRATTFRRWGTQDAKALDDARLCLGRLEIARLDNDPSYPEHGILRTKMEGGK